MGIARANAAIPSVDEHLGALIAGEFPSDLDRFVLGVEVARNPFGSRPANRPPVPARDEGFEGRTVTVWGM